MTSGFPCQRAGYAESLSVLLRHHEINCIDTTKRQVYFQ